jgi:hypothetical protein
MGVYAGDKSAFSIHGYRSMLATDFAAAVNGAGFLELSNGP